MRKGKAGGDKLIHDAGDYTINKNEMSTYDRLHHSRLRITPLFNKLTENTLQ